MSDLVLRAIGQLVCLSTVGIFVLTMSLVTLSTDVTSAHMTSASACRGHHCPALAPEPLRSSIDAQHLKAIAAHLWGDVRG